MSGTIKVRGSGSVSVAPDSVVISMTLTSLNKQYEVSMKQAAEQLNQLREALAAAGFGKETLNTSDFNVSSEYDYRFNEEAHPKKIFRGYMVSHYIEIQFDFTQKRLSDALVAIGACPVNPQVSIRFTVKNKDAVADRMLRSATRNAKRRADVLCKASGKTLGELLSIEYDLEKLNLFSDTSMDVDEKCMNAHSMAKCREMDIIPQDIEYSDDVVFVWEIK